MLAGRVEESGKAGRGSGGCFQAMMLQLQANKALNSIATLLGDRVETSLSALCTQCAALSFSWRDEMVSWGRRWMAQILSPGPALLRSKASTKAKAKLSNPGTKTLNSLGRLPNNEGALILNIEVS